MNAKVRAELESIRQKGKGVLRPKAVVKFAENPKTALHKLFEWNDKKAAFQHRLELARDIIVRVKIEVSGRDSEPISVRLYQSLDADRATKDGGYRSVHDIMSNKSFRKELLDTALAELEVFERRYSDLKELSVVMTAIRKVRGGRKRAVKKRARRKSG